MFWHLGDGVSLFSGPLHYNAPHFHSVPIFMCGIYEDFRIRLKGSPWLICRCAVIPAGTHYELDVRGQPLSVVYLEPQLAGVDGLVPLLHDAEETFGAVFGQSGALTTIRSLYEQTASDEDNREMIHDLIAQTQTRARRTLDSRISRVVKKLSHNEPLQHPAPHFAAEVGLSNSRFQHLFTSEVGVPFRRYRGWQRLRLAIASVVFEGKNYTAAAHEAGYFDQAHFNRHFRQTFGAPISNSLSSAQPFV